MGLPTAFAGLTAATGQELDNNFAALGALTPIPCTASGGNTVVLAANANTPTVTAYSNYMQFSGVAAQSNTGAATGKVGSLATLNIYKPGTSGPVALTGGEMITGVAFILLYDSALNTGSGGFHLMNRAPSQVITASLASVTTLSVGGGQTITRILSTTSSISWPSLAPQTSAESVVALGGCSVGDCVQIGYPASISSQITFRGYVPNAGTVAMVAQNYSASSITPVAGVFRAMATGFT